MTFHARIIPLDGTIIATEFKSFLGAVTNRGQIKLSPLQHEQIEQAYYAGAVSMIGLFEGMIREVSEAPDDDLSGVQLFADVIDALGGEVNAFSDKSRQRGKERGLATARVQPGAGFPAASKRDEH